MSRVDSGYGRRSRRAVAEAPGQAYTDHDLEQDLVTEDEHPTDTGPAPRRRKGGSRRAKGGASRRRRGDSAQDKGTESPRGVERVSAFSASAIKKVSVLGDRPNQIVYTLAEQSKRKRGTAVLAAVSGAFAVALIALLGLLGYQLFNGAGTVAGGDDSIVAPPAGHSTLTPELYLSEPNRDDVFGPINERPEGLEPMTAETVFGSVEELELDGIRLQLQDSDVTDSCTSLVWGDELGQSLIDANCVNAATGIYSDPGQEYVAQVTLFDLANADGATEAEAALNPTDPDTGMGFLLAQTGDGIDGLQEGYSQANAQVMGHYLAVFWVARTDGTPPGDDADLATLSVAAMKASNYVYQEVVAAKEG
ncbi:hypothetical protein [Nocardiopsis algeriensis]|uniref:Uncharacterized protein n=1 Tax=Nocardiopsis algeriensis TaxID=1478215 RepID=A0A841IYR9_9ACTN|nr:hypothetical protein [Nocardiopsis algeriensis]